MIGGLVLPVPKMPTAHASFGEIAAIPFRRLSPPGALGLLTICQAGAQNGVGVGVAKGADMPARDRLPDWPCSRRGGACPAPTASTCASALPVANAALNTKMSKPSAIHRANTNRK